MRFLVDWYTFDPVEFSFKRPSRIAKCSAQTVVVARNSEEAENKLRKLEEGDDAILKKIKINSVVPII